MLYWVKTVYYPNSAEQNLTESRVKGLALCGHEVTLVYVRPNISFDRLTNLDTVTVLNIWKLPLLKARKGSKLLYLQYVIARLCSFHLFSHFCKRLTKEDNIIIDAGEEYYKSLFKSKAGIYLSRVEHPEAYGAVHFKQLQAKRLKNNRHYYRKADGVFVLTSGLKKFFISEGVEEQKIHIVNMSVDESRFNGLKKNTGISDYIGYCGTVSLHKDGVDDLIKAFAIVHKSFPSVSLMIMGKFGSEKDKNEVVGLIKSHNISNSVILTGLLPSKDMPQRLKDAKLLALTRQKNLQTENGFPTKLAEYLLTENPVVVTKTGDIPNFLENGKTAFLSEPGDICGIASQMILALRNQELSESIGQNGAEVARQSFNCKIEANKIITVLQMRTGR